MKRVIHMKRTLTYLGMFGLALVLGWTIHLGQAALDIPTSWPLPTLSLALVAIATLWWMKRPERLGKTDFCEGPHPFHIVLFIAFVPFLLAIVAKSVTSFFTDPTPLAVLFPEGVWWAVLLVLPVVALMEELFWRVTVLPRLDAILAPLWLVTDLLLALLWSAWWMLWLPYDPVVWLGVLLITSGLSLLFGDITRRFGVHLISVALGHLAMSLGLYYLHFTETLTGLAMVVYGIITVLFAIYYLVPAKKIHKN